MVSQPLLIPSPKSPKSYADTLKSNNPDPLKSHCSFRETQPASALQKPTKVFPPIHTSDLKACMKISKCYTNISYSVVQGVTVSPPFDKLTYTGTLKMLHDLPAVTISL